MAAGAEPKGSVARVRETLARLGLETEIKEFDASTRTSADAAAAIGCTVAQIAKSVIFRARSANQPVLVIASGANAEPVRRLFVLKDGLAAIGACRREIPDTG